MGQQPPRVNPREDLIVISRLFSTLALSTATAVVMAFAVAPSVAAPEIVAGPGADPDCYKPWAADTKFFK